ncbi:hypothetical protein ZWY2020_057595 [Hordeum vulgare]|nr:hypothetical protein ZWY2020_057595 [Hordeum vulgare]
MRCGKTQSSRSAGQEEGRLAPMDPVEEEVGNGMARQGRRRRGAAWRGDGLARSGEEDGWHGRHLPTRCGASVAGDEASRAALFIPAVTHPWLRELRDEERHGSSGSGC